MSLPVRPLLALATAALLCHGPAFALTDAQFQPADASFRAALAGDADAVDAAARAFETLQRDDPGHPLPLAYGGAVETMRARSTMLPWKKLAHAEEGLASIDKGLALLTPAHDAERLHGVPTSLLVKFTAARTFLAMPAPMNRAARGRRLLEDVRTSPLLAATPAPFREAVARVALPEAAR